MEDPLEESIIKPIFMKVLIIGVLLVIALIITLGISLLKPYASGCSYEGNDYTHLEEFQKEDGCNTCTCNNGEVKCLDSSCDFIEK